MLKSYGVVGFGRVVLGGVVAHEILVSAQGPLVFGFLGLGLWGFGPGLDNLKKYLLLYKPRAKSRRSKTKTKSNPNREREIWPLGCQIIWTERGRT